LIALASSIAIGIDSDLGSMFVGSNHFLLSRVWLCFAGYGLDGDDSSFGDKAGAASASLGAIQSLGGTIGGSMVALIGGSIYRAMPVAMIAGGVVALTLSLSLGAVVTAQKYAPEPA
jgi:DHA1 family bicyclomycin/chloramphenicol resistance-like MFS transporter